MTHQAGRTRWRRFAAVLVPGVAACAALGIAMAQGALAASFFVSGQKFQISADSLTASGFSLYTMVDMTRKHEAVPVLVTGVRHASVSGLCQSMVVDLPVLGQYTVRLSGGEERPIEASDLFLDVTAESAGQANFRDLDIGIAQGSLTTGPVRPEDRSSRLFDPDLPAQQARSISLTNVRTTAIAVSAGSFDVPGLRAVLKQGRHECF
ncbi:DUF6230 family protein [Streptomyces sp. NPDC048297]|uniref:DUF6230 family protein n=1 Tax=Streptomyces sp. NPDC048297 TaxID=3365531 RepID=UPI00372251D9